MLVLDPSPYSDHVPSSWYVVTLTIHAEVVVDPPEEMERPNTQKEPEKWCPCFDFVLSEHHEPV